MRRGGRAGRDCRPGGAHPGRAHPRRGEGPGSHRQTRRSRRRADTIERKTASWRASVQADRSGRCRRPPRRDRAGAARARETEREATAPALAAAVAHDVPTRKRPKLAHPRRGEASLRCASEFRTEASPAVWRANTRAVARIAAVNARVDAMERPARSFEVASGAAAPVRVARDRYSSTGEVLAATGSATSATRSTAASWVSRSGVGSATCSGRRARRWRWLERARTPISTISPASATRRSVGQRPRPRRP